MTEEWSVIASSKGHRIPRPGTEEEESVGEHLVIEGVEEATHDQMLEARREERDREGDNPLSPPSVETASQWRRRIDLFSERANPDRALARSLSSNQEFHGCAVCWSRTRRLRRAIHAGRQSDQMAPRAYHVVFRNFYPEKIHPGISRRNSRVRLPFQFYYNAAGDMHGGICAG